MLKIEGTVSPYMDRPRPVNKMFSFFCLFSFKDDRRESVCEQSIRATKTRISLE